MPLSAAMMNGSFVSDTSPSSTVTGRSLSAAFSCARAGPRPVKAPIARMRNANHFGASTRKTLAMTSSPSPEADIHYGGGARQRAAPRQDLLQRVDLDAIAS